MIAKRESGSSIQRTRGLPLGVGQRWDDFCWQGLYVGSESVHVIQLERLGQQVNELELRAL